MKSTILLSAFSLASLGSAAVHGERGLGLQRHQALHSSSSSSKTSTTIKTSTRPASSSLKTSSKATSSSIKSSSKSSSKV
ncbi:hypothetical protein KCU78_g15937, partial [Aureobasidium melanogenum]